jgi:hypothetical protein
LQRQFITFMKIAGWRRWVFLINIFSKIFSDTRYHFNR